MGRLRAAVSVTPPRSVELIGILLAVLVAALVYFLCMALGLPSVVGIVAAILVLLVGIPTGGHGFGRRSRL